MSFLRLHWYDIGLVLAVVTGVMLIAFPPEGLSLLLWLSLISLFIHQAEEYRFPGTFPGMMNRVMFGSHAPDRYPLNSNTALVVNVFVGWTVYFLAAVFSGRAVWLAIAAILVSCGNFIAHTILFNVRGRTRYNPGMASAILLFAPLSTVFFYLIARNRAAAPIDWVIGVALGIALNYLGVLKLIDLLKDPGTPYVFPPRNIPAAKGEGWRQRSSTTR